MLALVMSAPSDGSTHLSFDLIFERVVWNHQTSDRLCGMLAYLHIAR
jgi:hypothetical protein